MYQVVLPQIVQYGAGACSIGASYSYHIPLRNLPKTRNRKPSYSTKGSIEVQLGFSVTVQQLEFDSI